MAETTCKFHPDRTDVFYTYPLPPKLAHAFEGWSLCVECRERMANGDIQYFIEAQQRTTSKRR